MEKIEYLVGLHRTEIVRCIKEPTIVSLLETDLLSEDDAKRLRSDCHQLPNLWVSDMIDTVKNLKVPGKWRTFLQALEKAEYPYLQRLLTGSQSFNADQERMYIKKIGLHRPLLEQAILLPDILTDLSAHRAINDVDKEEINSRLEAKGNTHGVSLLLDRMQCRLAPVEWYHIFLNVLKEKYEHLIVELEPDFLERPEEYLSIVAKSKQKDLDMEVCSIEEVVPMDEEVEHVLKEHVQPEMSFNNLSQPSALQGKNVSMETIYSRRSENMEMKVSNVEVNLAGSLNIKPEMSLNSNDRSLTDVKGKIKEESWKKKISSNYRRLVADIDPYLLLDVMIEKDFVPFIKLRDIRELPNTSEKNRAILNRVLQGDTRDFKKFLSLLKRSGNDVPAKLLGYKAKRKQKDLDMEVSLIEKDVPKDDEVQHVLKEDAGVGTSDDNPLLSDDDADDNITSIRAQLKNYQVELAEKAVCGKNTVICAPTGIGKTWVAMYIIQEHLSACQPGKGKVVFMTRTGALVQQQYNRIRKHLPDFQTKILQGESEDSRMLGGYLQDYQIFCFTPQILVNNLEYKSVESITKFSLIILDECHHTKKDSPYSNLMRLYLQEKFNNSGQDSLPQIVGLTATLGVGKSSTDTEALDYIYKLLALLDVKELSTVQTHREDMLKEISEPSEETITMQKRAADRSHMLLLNALEETEDQFNELARKHPSMVDLMVKSCPRNKESQEYNKWTREVMKASQTSVDDNDTSRNIFSCATYLNVYNQAFEVNSLLQTNDVIKFLAEKHRYETEQKEKLTLDEQNLLKRLMDVQKNLGKEAYDNENPNVRLLSKKLRTMLQEGGEDSCAMVFVEAQATCKALASFLDRDLKNIGRTHALYGKETRGSGKGMTRKDQDETVQKFREGIYKVLVATSIGQEGIDIPECNMSLSYNYIGNEITKVQRRGRIRKRGGTNITFVQEKYLNKERISAYKEVMMNRALKMFEKEKLENVQKKIDLYQKKEINDINFKRKIETGKMRRKTDDNDYEIRCGRCNAFACFASGVRRIRVHYIVIEKEFENRIITKPHNSPKVFEGFNKNLRMFCKDCPMEWGSVANKNGVDCRILKLEKLKFVCMASRQVATYRKWIDFPYSVPEITADDLPRLYGKFRRQ